MPEKPTSQNQAREYNPKTDGTIEEYFERCNGKIDGALFRGSNQFRMLWGQGYIVPEMTVIRARKRDIERDEHFCVVNQSTIRGIFMPGSSGSQGEHNIGLLDSFLEYEIKNPFTKSMRNELEQSRKIKIPKSDYQGEE